MRLIANILLACLGLLAFQPARADNRVIPATPPQADRTWSEPIRYGDLVHVMVRTSIGGFGYSVASFEEAKSFCAEQIDGVTGWRLPTREEALADGRVPYGLREPVWLNTGRRVNAVGNKSGPETFVVCVHAPYPSSIPAARSDQRAARIAEVHDPALFPVLLFNRCLEIEYLESADEMRRYLAYLGQIGFTPEDLVYTRCHEPNYLPGGTLVPMFHIVPENSTDRLPIFDGIRSYFIDTQHRADLWRAIINAKNTLGMTPLDYMEYIMVNKRAILAEAPGIAAFIDYMCVNGAIYAYYAKTCSTAPQSVAGIEARLR